MRDSFSHPPNLRGVVDHLPATVSYWDLEVRCRFVNRAYEAWLGIDGEAMLGRTKRELLGPLYPSYLPYIEGALRGQLQEFEQVIPHPTTPRYGLAQYVPDVIDGRVRGFYALVTDVTRFKRAERTLLDIEQRLQTGERFPALTTLAAGIAHEINNPLTVSLAHVDLALECLTEAAPDIPTLVADLRAIRDNALRVRDIVQRMKLLALGGSARREVFDVNKVLEHSLEIAGSVLRHRARITCTLGTDLYVEGGAGQLAQLFVHLLTNASAALSETNLQANEIRVSTRREGTSVVVEVVDNGCGIPPALQPRIFEPFFTTQPVGAGMGLGLSISSAIAGTFGGKLSATSAVGQGSTFRLELPAARPPTPPAPGTAQSPVELSSGTAQQPPLRPRVLIIDDEPAVLKTLQRVLERDSEVIAFHQGREAIARLLDSSLPEPDVVLCDVMMPEPDGQAIYAQVTASRRELAERFVFMTGGASTQRSRSFLETVAAPIVPKPFDLPRLRALLHALARRTRGSRCA